MNRYSRTVDGKMKFDPDGGYVLWSEAITAIEDAKQTHPVAEMAKQANADAQEQALRSQGLNSAQALGNPFIGKVIIAPTDKLAERTNQLVNELYHDRARLERVINDAVELMEMVLEFKNEEFNVDYVEGMLRQFVDTHGDA